MRRIVIVGAGLAGHRAALALRAEGFAGEVVLISDEERRPYDRPPLSKQLLAGAVQPADLAYADHDDSEVTWMGGARAVGLRADAHEVQLDDGSAVGYDGLVIAAGRRARTVPALEVGPRVHVLRSLPDAERLRAAVARARSVVIAGAGFIGCEVAATLRAQGTERVHLVDVADHPMVPLGPEVGRRAAALHAAHGVELHLGTGVEAVGDGRATLADGTELGADLVLLALGSTPNSEWLEGSGVQLERGAVLCDEHCFAAGVDDVVAAGDIAAVPHPLADGAAVCIEHWAIARDMGAAAARNLVSGSGERRPFATVPTFWSDQYDAKIKSAGLLSSADAWRVVEDDLERPALVVEALRGGEVVGAVVWNRNRRAIDYTRAVAGLLPARATAA